MRGVNLIKLSQEEWMNDPTAKVLAKKSLGIFGGKHEIALIDYLKRTYNMTEEEAQYAARVLQSSTSKNVGLAYGLSGGLGFLGGLALAKGHVGGALLGGAAGLLSMAIVHAFNTAVKRETALRYRRKYHEAKLLREKGVTPYPY